MVPTDLVHMVVGPGRGKWDRGIQSIMSKLIIAANFGMKQSLRLKKTKTNITALAKFMELNSDWADFH